MTTIEYAVSLVDSHWFNCNFEDAKKHSIVSLNRIKEESNSMLDSWWQGVNKNIKELTIEEFSNIKNKKK